MDVTLWAFDKKRNSTKQPETAGTKMQGELKQNFTLTGLEVTFNFGKQLYAPVFNYCHIPNLRRYYFITDWYYNAGLWVAVCAVDVLATYKTQIGVSRQYVIRAYSKYDASIVDTAYLTKARGILRNNATLTPTQFWGADAWGNNGTVVIGVVGANQSSAGAVCFRVFHGRTFPQVRFPRNCKKHLLTLRNISYPVDGSLSCSADFPKVLQLLLLRWDGGHLTLPGQRVF